MPEVISALKLRLLPNEEAAGILDSQSKKCNWLYNHLLERANALRDEYKAGAGLDSKVVKTLYSQRGLRNLVPEIKEAKPFLKTVHSSPLKNVALRLSASIQAHQKSRKGKRKGKLTGWPKFRSFKIKWFSLFYDEPGKGFSFETGALRLSLGQGLDKNERSLTLEIAEPSALKGKTPRNLRLTKEAGVYYAVVTVTTAIASTQSVEKVIALDPNHKNFAYGVDNNGKAIEVEKPYWLRRLDTRVDEIKSLRDMKLKRSKSFQRLDEHGQPTGRIGYDCSRSYKKMDALLNGVYAKRREQTKTFMFTLANSLFSQYQCVAIGDYTPRGGGITTPMRRVMNNQSLIGRFKETTSWVAQKSGRQFIEFDEKGTTRTCHHCDRVVENGLAPHIRAWECAGCGQNHIRDENAAINGLKRVLWDAQQKGLGFPRLVPGSGPVVKERWAWRVGPSGVRCTPRGMHSSSMGDRQEIKQKAWEPSIQRIDQSAHA